MINQKAVANIQTHGICKESEEGRLKVLNDIGFKMDKNADYVIMTGCFNPEGMPPAFRALRGLLDYLKINYTLLSREYCCGWMPLGQPAVMAKNEEDIAKSKELSREFVRLNFRQAEALGAKSVVRFCAACEPTYTNYAGETKLELISYSELLDRYFNSGRLDAEIDYYAGCYRFRRRITTTPVDLSPSLRLLNKITGLRVNHLDNNLCCYIPPHLEQLTDSLKTKTVVAICSGCYGNVRRRLAEESDYEVKMLPEILWGSVDGTKNL
jgi:Fe-S oxidoreductase